MFAVLAKKPDTGNNNGGLRDIEDVTASTSNSKTSIVTVTKRKRGSEKENEFSEDDLNKTWREVLGNPPPIKV